MQRYLLTINRQLTKRNNRSKTSIYKQLKKQKSNKQKNSAKLRKKKKIFFRYFCKKKKKTCKLKVLLFKLTIIISLFNLVVITFTIYY